MYTESCFKLGVSLYRRALVVDRVLRISEIKDDSTMRSCTTTSLGKDLLKVNGTVEAKRSVIVDVNPVTLVISRSVDDRDLQALA
jgi:hypothetical protein